MVKCLVLYAIGISYYITLCVTFIQFGIVSANASQHSQVTLTVSGLTQEELKYVGENLDVKVKLTGSLKHDGKYHFMVITLSNQGTAPIQTRTLKLYFHSFSMVEPDHLPNPNGFVSNAYNVKLFHINGMLFRAEFLPNFGNINPGQSKQIELKMQDWAVSKTDVPGNWYVTSGTREPRILKSTSVKDQSFVEDFVEPNQYKRYKADVYNPYTPWERFDRVKGRDLGYDAVASNVIPTPTNVTFDLAAPLKSFTVDLQWKVVAPEEFKDEADFLGEKLGLVVTVFPKIGHPLEDFPRPSQLIALERSDYVNQSQEAYQIEAYAHANFVSIKGQTKIAIFYGIQTFLGLLRPTFDMGNMILPAIVPDVFIMDEPRFPYRGLHFDIARNFQSKESIKRLIDIMARYKLNKLQLHMSDDEGWRIEIPGLPELTRTGAKRCHDLKERRCIIPQLGSGPESSPPGSGFLTKADYRDILRHATKNRVEIIPAFQMPTHAHAAIEAMDERYRLKGDVNYLLRDIDDASTFYSPRMFSNNVMNPCIESTYNFIKTVIKALKNMHADIAPLNYFHFGGEKVPDGAWENSTACLKAFPNMTQQQAKSYFMSRLLRLIIIEEGLKVAGYEDAFLMDGKPLQGGSENFSVHAYQNIWELGAANRAYAFANAEYQVVMSPDTFLSFDHPYEPDPNERGLYWATRFIDTYKVYQFRPDNLYNNIDVKRSGEIITKEAVCGVDGAKCQRLERPNNVKGIQAFLWSDLIPDCDTLDYMLFPRLLALAERAWHKADWEMGIDEPLADWEVFKNTIGYKEFPKLDLMGVKYRVPPPGLSIGTTDNVNFLVTMKAEFPGLPIQYSSDNGTSWKDYKEPFYLTDQKPLMMRTLSSDRKRTSRVIGFSIDDLKLL